MPKKKRRTTGSSRSSSPAQRRPSSVRSKPTQPPTVRPGGDSALRTAVAKRSRGIVIALSALPGFIVPAAIVILMIIGLVSPLAVAVPALAIILVFMAWLAFLSWPVLAAPQRTMRVLAIGIVVVGLVGRFAGWF